MTAVVRQLAALALALVETAAQGAGLAGPELPPAAVAPDPDEVVARQLALAGNKTVPARFVAYAAPEAALHVPAAGELRSASAHSKPPLVQ